MLVHFCFLSLKCKAFERYRVFRVRVAGVEELVCPSKLFWGSVLMCMKKTDMCFKHGLVFAFSFSFLSEHHSTTVQQ